MKTVGLAILGSIAVVGNVASAFAPSASFQIRRRSRNECCRSFTCNSAVIVPERTKAHVARLALLDPVAENAKKVSVSARSVVAALALLFAAVSIPVGNNAWADSGASSAANAKITTGGASTLQSGRTIAITRGVNLDRSDFKGQNLKGVAFQQSIVRDADFRGTNLVGSSFFDATVDGSDFEGADLTLSNVEMAQFKRANLKNAVVREMYVSGATLFEGVDSIEGSDWTDTMLRKDQQKYLCEHPTAKGTNPTTGVDTRESLMCLD